jgi:hypothetical protein
MEKLNNTVLADLVKELPGGLKVQTGVRAGAGYVLVKPIPAVFQPIIKQIFP